MAFISIDLDSDTMRALKAAAAAEKLSPEHFLQKLVGNSLATPAILGWAAKEVLECLRRAGARPGVSVPLQSLVDLWAQTNAADGEAVWRGIDELVWAGLLTFGEGREAGVALIERVDRT